MLLPGPGIKVAMPRPAWGPSAETCQPCASPVIAKLMCGRPVMGGLFVPSQSSSEAIRLGTARAGALCGPKIEKVCACEQAAAESRA